MERTFWKNCQEEITVKRLERMSFKILLRSLVIALIEILLIWGIYTLAKMEYSLKFFLVLFVGFVIIHFIIYSLEARNKNKN